jgi:8-oxo-dGTP pyrophosphatase MutT (NUDIX family)
MPGGHIEPGETIKEALSREVEEEIGIKIKPGKIVSYGELINSKDFHRQAHFIYFDIVGTIESGEIKLDNIELNEYRWVDPNECLSLDLAETYDITIKEYIKYKLATKIKEH